MNDGQHEPTRGTATMDLARQNLTPAIAWAALIAVTLTGCNEAVDTTPPDVRLELTTCLGPPGGGIGADGGATGGACREAMINGANDGRAGCFVARTADGVAENREMIWRDGGIAPSDDAPLGFVSGQRITAALFLGSFTACDTLAPDRPCADEDDCQLKLGPIEQLIALTGPTTINFATNGTCVVESGNFRPGTNGEPCDGTDNDCDGRIDEAILEPCTVGAGACELTGDRLICLAAGRVCADASGQLLAPSSRGPDTDCDGTDQDCDERIDEGGACDACVIDADCTDIEGKPQCVDSACRGCDPEDGAGCDALRPLCDDADYTCRICENDGECGAGLVCTPFVGCTACDPTRPETCTTPEQPVCDPEARTCRGCQGRGVGDCPEGFCFGGRCGPCDPAGHEGCANPTPICNARDLACRGCQNDPECSDADAATPICRQGACRICEVGTNEGCVDPGNPICVDGDPATCQPCDQNDPARRCLGGSCQNGRCVGCDPATNLGCLPNSDLPICDPGPAPPATAACRACLVSPECQNGRICHQDRCVTCIDGVSTGCDPTSATPICARAACRDCQNDNECIAREGDRDQCVDGRCEVCDPSNNAGCDNPALPTCRGGVCAACIADADCLGRQCLPDGRCAECDSADNAGCDATAPICGAGNTCRGCNADAECGDGQACYIAQADPRDPNIGQCFQCDPRRDSVASRLIDFGCDAAAPVCGAGNVCRACLNDGECNGGQCVGGQCAQCDPADGIGCDPASATPICNAARTCVGCNVDNRCGQLGRAPVCNGVDGRCVTCLRVTNIGCQDATPICDAGTACRACRAGECGAGLTCDVATGRCRACLPTPTDTCDGESVTPVCDPDRFECRGCGNNEECRTRNPNRPFCIEGSCLACDPDNHEGCSSEGNQPRCLGGTCTSCEGDDRNGDAFCAGLFQTPGGQCLASGGCGPCDPLDNSGCLIDSVRPVCNPTLLVCDACTGGTCSQGDCNAVSGRCVRCDPASAGACVRDQATPPGPALSVCDPVTLACVGCQGDDECDGHPYGPLCRGGYCVCSDRSDRCDLNSNRPACIASVCLACRNNTDCLGNPSGARCILDAGQNFGRCRP